MIAIHRPGKSAYELAVEAGFTGTLEDWLASLGVTLPEDLCRVAVSGDGAYVQFRNLAGDTVGSTLHQLP